ncbi:MAG: hypothetical protein P4N59_11520 [Negativicutes bacterium]|nr:hypothetical protein [Negativicutes bacterium]
MTLNVPGSGGNIISVYTPQSVTWASTITLPFTQSAKLYSTANANATLANPSAAVPGAEFTWDITQDATGSRLLAFGSLFVFPNGITPVLSTAAGATDTLCGYVRNDGHILVTPIYGEAT